MITPQKPTAKEGLAGALVIEGRIRRMEAKLTERASSCLRTEADLRTELGDSILAKSIYQDYLEVHYT
jgi:hypothetical protein